MSRPETSASGDRAGVAETPTCPFCGCDRHDSEWLHDGNYLSQSDLVDAMLTIMVRVGGEGPFPPRFPEDFRGDAAKRLRAKMEAALGVAVRNMPYLAALRAPAQGEGERMRETDDLIWLRDQVVALCEDTENRTTAELDRLNLGEHEQGFYRGAGTEAKAIRRAIFEVARVRLQERAVIRALDPEAPSTTRLVIVESPYAGDVLANEAYARAAMADCLRRGESPYASHLLLTQPGVLDDLDPDERRLGIEAGHAWYRAAQACVVYTDRGTSAGMRAGIAAAEAAGVHVEYRALDPEAGR